MQNNTHCINAIAVKAAKMTHSKSAHNPGKFSYEKQH